MKLNFFYFAACMCYTPGTVSGLNVCDQESGQCICKVDVTGQNCDTCIDGFYGLTENNPFGCVGMYIVVLLYCYM